jgi:hypothetical protein
VRSKTPAHVQVLCGRFLELVSDDPAFAGAIAITAALALAVGGINVTIRCEGVRGDYSLAGATFRTVATIQSRKARTGGFSARSSFTTSS